MKKHEDDKLYENGYSRWVARGDGSGGSMSSVIYGKCVRHALHNEHISMSGINVTPYGTTVWMNDLK